MRGLTASIGGKTAIIPKFNITDEFCERIYPGERISVEIGIEAARRAVWAPPHVSTAWLESLQGGPDSPIGIAVRQFIADTAN